MVIGEYLMMCRGRSQTYKDIGDSETCRERITREVSSLPWGFWKLAAAGFLAGLDFCLSIILAFLCVIKLKECWIDRTEEPLNDHSSENRLVGLAWVGQLCSLPTEWFLHSQSVVRKGEGGRWGEYVSVTEIKRSWCDPQSLNFFLSGT